MSRRIFLTAALDRLVHDGLIARRSPAHRIIKRVIEDGVTVLDDDEREIYDRDLIPKIEDAAASDTSAAKPARAAKTKRPTSH